MSEMTGADSVAIRMGNYTLLKYHSDKLSLDINYPSFLVHQDLSDDAGMQELFMMDDVSVSVVVDSLSGMLRSSGQVMMGMGALGTLGSFLSEYFSIILRSSQNFGVAWPYSLMGAS